MRVTETIVALIADAAERALWGPIFSKLEEKTMLVEMHDLSHVVKIFRNREITASLVIISTRVYPLAHPKIVRQARQLFPGTDVMLMSLSSDPPPPLHPLLTDNIRHLFINPISGQSLDPDRVAALFKASIQRLRSGTPLSMAVYLKPDTPIREVMVHSSEQKEELIAELEKTINGYSHEYEILRMKGALLADEMLENAFYAAPRGDGSQPLYRKGEKRALDDGETIVFRYGFDGESLALEVTDGWGSLSSDTFFRHLLQNMNGMGPHEEIGGRGLFIIWRFMDSIHIRINPGRETVVGGHVNLSTVGIPPETKGFHITTGP